MASAQRKERADRVWAADPSIPKVALRIDYGVATLAESTTGLELPPRV